MYTTLQGNQSIPTLLESNTNFPDRTWNIEKNLILHELWRVVSRSFFSLSTLLYFIYIKIIAIQTIRYTEQYL